MSARCCSVSLSSPWIGCSAMPMLASISRRMPSSTNGSRRCTSRFWATLVASAWLSTCGSRTPNSSPPRRATVSESRNASLQPARDLLQQQVAHVVAERVVDLLEVVEVHQHHHRGVAVAASGAERLVDAVAEQLAVGQAGERVMQRLVLLRDRLPAAAVDGEDRQEEQDDRRQREVRGQHDDRGQAEHQAVDRGLEEQVARHVLEDADALGERDHGRDEAGVEDEERDRGEQDAGQVARDEMRLGHARQVGRGLQDAAGGADRDRVLGEVERHLLRRLARRCVSATRFASPSASSAASGPATSMVAMANVVEVVTSPSAPRVKTFSGTNSPQKAKGRTSPLPG